MNTSQNTSQNTSRNKKNIGYIYCLSNPSFVEEIYIIGFTRNDPNIRKNNYVQMVFQNHLN